MPNKEETVKKLLNRLRNPKILECHSFDPDKVYMLTIDPTGYDQDTIATASALIREQFEKHGVKVVNFFAKKGMVSAVNITEAVESYHEDKKKVSKSEQRRLTIQRGK